MARSGDHSRFSALDALRGFAAMSIAVFHFSGAGWGGYLAVDFFLVLSGFILAHSYLYRDEPTIPLAFISHRLARLFPLHIFTLLTFVAATLLISGRLPVYPDGNISTFIEQITLTQNVGLNPGGMTWNYPSWSISVEFWVNILFIYFITSETSNILLLAVALIGQLLIAFLTGHLDTHASNYFGVLNSGLVRGLSSFMLGIVCYRIYLRCKNNSDAGIDRLARYLEPLCLIAVLVVVFARNGTHSHLDFLAPLLFMVVVVVFAFERGTLSRLLNRCSYLGVISYSIYLNQVTVLILLRHWLDWHRFPLVAFLAVYLSVLFAYSHLTYRYIERPLRRTCRDMLLRLVPAR